MSIFAVVRHGHYDDSGKLSPLGRRQIRAVGQVLLEALGGGPCKPVVFSSPCGYVQESSTIIAATLGNGANYILTDCLQQETSDVPLSDLIEVSRTQLLIAVTHLKMMIDIVALFTAQKYQPTDRLGDAIYMVGGGCLIDHREQTIRSIPVKLEA